MRPVGSGVEVALTHEAVVTLLPSNAPTLALRSVEKFCAELRRLGADDALEIGVDGPRQSLLATVDLTKVPRAEVG